MFQYLDGAVTVWNWTGSLWDPRSLDATEPAERGHYGWVTLSNQNQILMFGGENETTVFGDTWTHSNANWVERQAGGGGPSPRSRFAMAEHPSGALLFGGRLADRRRVAGDTWEYFNNSWRQRVDPEGPSARFDAEMALDRDREQIVLFGGQSPEGRLLDDLWEFGVHDRPSFRFDVQIPPDLTDREPEVARVRSKCGGFRDSRQPGGAELLIWSDEQGRWLLLDQNEFGEMFPPFEGPTDVIIEDSEVVEGLPTPRDQVHVRCRGRHAERQASVALDYLEVWLRYEVD
jgi:hypothetical protein